MVSAGQKAQLPVWNLVGGTSHCSSHLDSASVEVASSSSLPCLGHKGTLGRLSIPNPQCSCNSNFTITGTFVPPFPLRNCLLTVAATLFIPSDASKVWMPQAKERSFLVKPGRLVPFLKLIIDLYHYLSLKMFFLSF